MSETQVNNPLHGFEVRKGRNGSSRDYGGRSCLIRIKLLIVLKSWSIGEIQS